ncbi:hypothetical protein COW36_11490 [bacterium (Candidatus Blackallbacteria) CG17_big_fil_post_rev_8_21_14_2_50_48_46]|uniref:Uncharacterized protein n=1 Tax=bacterium (Candidatus Blackallbacteria) CG17_big_fil_post_rev_8_21_14_2_50_48_46 TaxID=2014261 RepID=A0A2M7G4D0_9BACT|nr:MAG: hypothetical protein COW64_21710 [bacterium (Candidatus Blackallbacteria) CG18_big_fil_WC_8_21_14_2_50_49_26]PIW16761.1 MAG: hypothetical protein COW36_11490 [bacterium (Candidatus Blackallbacteria) CG17_big_fil_post_rev_8_21_14_2_50_48_46]PIW49553.1 MAG: hypothetical protein COW20_05410 [bacterium (Candidatus Blackallbacteria) CG13_big_fil_rev_8_21_14_2_50_49_14]
MKSPVQVGLVQFSEIFQGHQFFPYSAGLLQAYAQKYLTEPENFEFCPPLFLPEAVEILATRLKDLQIVGFSVYVWNIRRSLALAQMLKLQNPQVLILFGGPQIPDQAETFLRENPWVDLCCHGPGEAAFTQILENYSIQNWQNIPGLSYLDDRGNYIYQPPAPRQRSLADIPSPYHSEVFLPLLRAYPHLRWIAPWETNRGCPFSCSFCDWGSATASKISQFDQEMLYRDLEWFGNHQIDMIFCCDANFGILKRDLEIAAYAGSVFQRKGYPHTFHQQTAKNAPERTWELHQIFAKAGIYTEVTLSLQSMDAHTLKQIKRDNISLQTFLELQKRFQAMGVPTYTDMILGLPGETYASFTRGVEAVIASGQHSRMQFYNALVLPNAEMGQASYRAHHGIETAMITLHPERLHAHDIIEQGEMVIATASLPRADWLKTRVFAWFTKFLYYIHKPLQIPLLLLNQIGEIPFRQLIERFMEADPHTWPCLASLTHFFMEKAQGLQAGQTETCWMSHPTRVGLEIPVPPEQYLLLTLCQENQLNAFYSEVESLLLEFLQPLQSSFSEQLLRQSIALNAALFKTSYMTALGDPVLPFHQETLEVNLDFNLPEVYQALLSGLPWQLKAQPLRYFKNWQGPPYELQVEAPSKQ